MDLALGGGFLASSEHGHGMGRLCILNMSVDESMEYLMSLSEHGDAVEEIEKLSPLCGSSLQAWQLDEPA